MPLPNFHWADNSPTEFSEPIENLKDTGYVTDQFPSAGEINWIFNAIQQTLDFLIAGGGGAINTYDTIAALKAVNGADLTNNSKTYVKEFGVYLYDSSSTQAADNEFVLLPADSTGRHILILPHGNAIIAYQAQHINFLQEQINNLDSRLRTLEA